MRISPDAVFSCTIEGELVALVDLDGETSVTNDAEAVVAHLVASGVDLTGKRLVYRDPLGTWDELVVRDGRFAGFGLLDALTLDHARRLVDRPPGPPQHPDPQP